MKLTIDTVVPASPETLWILFLDVPRTAQLMPGCEQVEEVEHLKSYTALIKQKVGPFKLSVPTTIIVEHYDAPNSVCLTSNGKDKFSGTNVGATIDVTLSPEQTGADGASATRLEVQAEIHIRGKLATLGFGVVKRKTEELFTEFEKRLRSELKAV